MSKAQGWGGGQWTLEVELSFMSIFANPVRLHLFFLACFSGYCGHCQLD